MKRMIMAVMLIAASFSMKAQVNPGFETKCDNLFDAMQAFANSVQQNPTQVPDFSTVISLAEAVKNDSYYATQFSTYVQEESEGRPAGFPIVCLAQAMAFYSACSNTCTWGSTHGGGLQHCSGCPTYFQQNVLNCFTASKPVPKPLPNK